MSGKLIMVDGLDGCGKTTVISSIKSYLDSQDIDSTIIRAFGSGPIGNAIRARTVDNKHHPDPISEAVLGAAAHIETFMDSIKPALDEGKIVLLDRSIGTFMAFQQIANFPTGMENGKAIAMSLTETLMNILKDLLNHEDCLYIWCEVPVDVAEERLAYRQDKSPRDQFSLEYKNYANAGFCSFFHLLDHGEKVRLNNTETPEVVSDKVKEYVVKFLNQ